MAGDVHDGLIARTVLGEVGNDRVPMELHIIEGPDSPSREICNPSLPLCEVLQASQDSTRLPGTCLELQSHGDLPSAVAGLIVAG